MTHEDLSDEQLHVLAECYAETPLALDDLPYTRQFVALRDRFRERTGLELQSHYIWKALSNLRKAGKLARKRT